MGVFQSRTRIWLLIGAIFGGLAVALGAMGAHWLESQLKEPDGTLSPAAQRSLAIWETAVRYQMYHALALLAVGLLAQRSESLAFRIAGWAMTIGVLIFSGCLYALVLSGQKWLGAIVPIGGVLMLVGWGLLAVGVSRPSTAHNQD
jgi:uncharacterized membrane protein YgdD (TMEM256/DUF423 family)